MKAPVQIPAYKSAAVVVAALLVATLVPAKARSPGAQPAADGATKQEEWQAICKALARTGAKIMEGRQRGMPMIESMEIAGAKPGPISDFAKTLVLEAYKKPRYQTKAMQVQEIQDFEDEVFRGCLQASSKR